MWRVDVISTTSKTEAVVFGTPHRLRSMDTTGDVTVAGTSLKSAPLIHSSVTYGANQKIHLID